MIDGLRVLISDGQDRRAHTNRPGGCTGRWVGPRRDWGIRPLSGPDAAAAAHARREGAERTAHQLALEVETLRGAGIGTYAGLAQALMERGVAAPRVVRFGRTRRWRGCRGGLRVRDSGVCRDATHEVATTRDGLDREGVC